MNTKKKQPSILSAILIFLVIGFIGNVIFESNQSQLLQKRSEVGNEILANIQTLNSKIDNLERKILKLEENMRLLQENTEKTGN